MVAGPATEEVRCAVGWSSGYKGLVPFVVESASSRCFSAIMEDLKHKLLLATLELETLRANAKEEKRKREEDISHLIHLLQVITRERDAARNQLQLLVDSITRPHTGELSPMLSGNLQEAATASDSLSGTPTHRSYGASPVASPELSSMKMADPCNLPKNNGAALRAKEASAVLDGLVIKKPLPEKGKLLQAVLEAGPTLQTLLLAGPLPRWRNPPPPQPFQVPPVETTDLSSPTPRIAPATGLCTIKRPLTSPCMSNYGNLALKRQKTRFTGGYCMM
ncbi:hypothetical protein B296_00034073 [Ensete ventricosum]|uniref:Uncharacterized protein n=1 Tax=Ensete ventricosum TaxID=4639 RepID=A0A426XAP2_ENSVE|nr:hypothetical protein B296_00034073 [Ensete ventricosum]